MARIAKKRFVCSLLAALALGFLSLLLVFGQRLHGVDVWAFVRAALASVSLNGGSNQITDGVDLTSSTTSLAPDTGAYRWLVDSADYASVNIPFNSGVTQSDITAFGRNGTTQNGAAYTASGKVGGGVALDGTDDYVSFASVPSQYPLTMALWFYATDETDRTLIDTNGTFGGLRIYLNSSGNLVYTQFDNNAPACRTVTSLAAVAPSTWTHVVIRRHHASGQMALFVNGVLQGTNALSAAPANEAATDLKLGQGMTQQDCMGTVPPNFSGTIDEFQMYQRVLSDDQIFQIYTDGNAGLGGPTIIDSTETTVGSIWNLTVYPVTSGGTIGSAVTSGNTVFVGTSLPAPVPVLRVPDRGVLRSGASQPITWSATDNSSVVSSINLQFTSDDSSYNPISGASSLGNGTSMVLLNKWGVSSGLGTESMSSPQFIAIDSGQNTYFTDNSFNQVYKYSSAGSFVTVWGGSGTGNGQFDQASGIAITGSDDVYVVDSNNARVQTFTSAGVYQSQWGAAGTANGQFSLPRGITADATPYLYVADTGNNRIQRFDSSGSFLGWIGRCTSGTNCNTTLQVTTQYCTDCSGVGSGSLLGQFNGPRDVAVNSNGYLFVSDSNNDRVQRFAANGAPISQWGSSGSSNGQFSTPMGIGIGQNNRVYVTDSNNHRVQVFTDGGSFISTWGTTGNADGALVDPFDVVLDPTGIAYVIENSSTRDKIHQFAPGGTFAWTVPSATDTSLARVKVQALDPTNNTGEVTSSQTLRISTFFVQSTSPALNSHGATTTGNISIVMSGSLNPATVTPNTVPVMSNMRGYVDGSYSITTTNVSNDTIVFDPTTSLELGEYVRVTLTDAVQSNTAKIAVPNVLKFLVEGGISSTAYSTSTSIPTPSGVMALEVADINNDGNLDIIGINSSNGISYLQGDGMGGFTLNSIANTNTTTRRMVAQDFNKDGNIDVAYVAVPSTSIGVRLGNGDGTFASASTIVGSTSVNSVYSADLNMDGNVDLIATSDTGGVPGNGVLRVNFGVGDGTFGASNQYTVYQGLMYHLGIDDLNNDGFPDIAVGTYWGYQVVTFLNNGDGSLRRQNFIEQDVNETAYHVSTVDVSGDNIVDLIRMSTGNGRVFSGDGQGGFPTQLDGLSPSGEYVGADLDSDGDVDLLTSDTNFSDIAVKFNAGAGTFPTGTTLSMGGITFNAAYGDMNRDGTIDVIGSSINNTTEVKVFFNNPKPTVAVVSPNGGESIAQSSSFPIIWSAYDESGVISSVNLQLTTNNSTYSAIPGATGLSNGSAYPFALTWGSQGTGTGQFGVISALEGPIGIDINDAGQVYVVDASNSRVQVFSATGSFISTFGTGGSGNGQFNNPRDVAFDSTGNIYISDTFNHRIQKFNSSGTYISQWGSLGSGNGQFNRPWGIAIDSGDNIYVVEQSGDRVQKFDTSGTYLAQWGSTGSGNGQFNAPRMIDIDSSDNIYITDESNNRVQKFNASGTYVTQWGTSGTGAGEFQYTQGIAVDPQGNIFVSDANERVQKFTNTGTFLMEFGSLGTGNGQFDRPFGLKADSRGRLYVADTFNQRVQLFNPGGTFNWTVPATPTVLARVRAIASDGTASHTDSSDAVFTIAGPNSAPTVPITLYSNNNTAQTGAANPTGLTDQTPAFSAICNDPDSGDILNKYRVQVDNNNDFSSVIWDSGALGTGMTNCTAGSRSADITFGGTPLALDGGLYYWRIKFWDDSNAEGVFSETLSTNTFTMAVQSSSIQRTQPSLPSTPTVDHGESSAADAIRWYFTDTSNVETGFRLLDAQDQVLLDVAQTDLTFIEETGLQANTAYEGRRIVAYNDAGTSTASNVLPGIVTPLPVVRARVVLAGPDFMEIGTTELIPNLALGQSGLQFELVPVAASATAHAAATSPWVQTDTYRFDGLQPGETYQVRARGRNQNGVETEWSTFASQATNEADVATLTVNFDVRYSDGTALPQGDVDPRRTLNGTVTVGNTGTAEATNVFANVPLPSGISFVAGTLLANGVGQTAAADVDASQGNDNAVSSIWASLAPGQTHTMTFQLRFDEAVLKSFADRPAAVAALSLTLQASVSSQETPVPVMSQSIVLSPDLSVYTTVPQPVEPIEPQPVPLPTPQEVQTIEQVTQQVFGNPSTEPSETSVTNSDEGFSVSVGSGSNLLVVMGQASTDGKRLELRGTTNQPYAVITLIFNDSVTSIVVSDATGEWRTFVDAEQLGIEPGQTETVRVEVVAAKGELRSERVDLGAYDVFRGRNGDAIAGLEPIVSAAAFGALFGPAGERAVEAIAEQQPAIRTTLVVSAPVVVASSVPLWGYIPYVPTLLYHAIGWGVGTVAGRKKKRDADTYGVVYDAITKQPLPLAIVRVYAQAGHKLVSTVVTDSLGRYDMLLPPGEYEIEVSKPQYQFPSSIVSGTQDGTFNRLYTGSGIVTITTGSALAPHIPVDPLNVRRQWELAFGLRKAWLAFQRVGNYLATPLMVVGFITSLALIAVAPGRAANWLMAGLYGITLVSHLKLRPKIIKAWGVVYDLATNAVLPLVTVQLIETASSKVTISRLTDYEGRFTFLPQVGTYTVKASKNGFEQVSAKQEVINQTDTSRQPLPDEIRISKPNERISGDIAMKQAS